MKAAFAFWDDRLAPVFDTARYIHLVDIESGMIVSESKEELPDGLLLQKASRLAELGVDILVCGAISRSLQGMVTACGIKVMPFLAGNLGEVIHAWIDGNLINDSFAMPGCCGRGLRRRDSGHVSDQASGHGMGRGCRRRRIGSN